MLVKMTQERQYSPDGIHATTLEAGKVYDLPPLIAQSYISRKMAIASKPATAKPAKTQATAPAIVQQSQPPVTQATEPEDTKDS